MKNQLTVATMMESFENSDDVGDEPNCSLYP
jgi:hypothetical protein